MARAARNCSRAMHAEHGDLRMPLVTVQTTRHNEGRA
jgi:hypothetical protein